MKRPSFSIVHRAVASRSFFFFPFLPLLIAWAGARHFTGTAAAQGQADADAAVQAPQPAPKTIQLEINPKELPGGLQPTRVKEVSLPGVLETTGLVTFDDRKLATISARVQGRIESVKASVWDAVEKGQPILELYSPDFMTAEAEYLQARAMRESRGLSDISQWMMEAAKRKLELLGMSEEDILAVSSPSTTITMRAPISGTILQNQAVRGSAVNPGDVLYQVGTLDHVWITGDLYEADMARVEVGQELAAVTTAYPEEVFHGRISRISPSIDPNAHTAQLKCEVDNPGHRLKPQMLARLRILTKPGAALIVPQEALVFDGDAYYAFVQLPDDKTERRKVQISTWNEQGFARVVSGLKTGERVLPEALKLNALWHQARGESY